MSYERRDVNVTGVGLFLGGLAVLVAVVMGSLVALWHAHLPPAAVAVAPPPEPRLLASPGHPTLGPQDLQELLASEHQLLARYSWVDRDAGIVRIPIRRAMQLLVERGLPTRQPASGGVFEPIPTDASSGSVWDKGSP